MAFAEIERVLGFELPPSARSYPAWWSNNEGSHVAVKHWRNAGWKTSRVDVAGGRVVFVRDAGGPKPQIVTPPAFGQSSDHVQAGVAEGVFIPFEQMTPAVRRMLEDYCEAAGEEPAKAVADILHSAALERRRALVEKFARTSPRVSGDSTDLVREDRDER